MKARAFINKSKQQMVFACRDINTVRTPSGLDLLVIQLLIPIPEVIGTLKDVDTKHKRAYVVKELWMCVSKENKTDLDIKEYPNFYVVTVNNGIMDVSRNDDRVWLVSTAFAEQSKLVHDAMMRRRVTAAVNKLFK